VIWYFIYQPEKGILNLLLRMVGLPGDTIWLGSRNTVLPALVVVGVWKQFGYYAVLFLAGLQDIPPSLHEAAAIDGASRWQSLTRITLPLMRPTLGLVTVLSGKTLGGVFADEALRTLVRGIMNEIVAIAGKKGIDLAEDVVAASLARAGNFPFEAKTSFQRDVETREGKNEGDLFGGTIIRMGGALGIDTPITQSVYERIQKLRLE